LSPTPWSQDLSGTSRSILTGGSINRKTFERGSRRRGAPPPHQGRRTLTGKPTTSASVGRGQGSPPRPARTMLHLLRSVEHERLTYVTPGELPAQTTWRPSRDGDSWPDPRGRFSTADDEASSFSCGHIPGRCSNMLPTGWAGPADAASMEILGGIKPVEKKKKKKGRSRRLASTCGSFQ